MVFFLWSLSFGFLSLGPFLWAPWGPGRHGLGANGEPWISWISKNILGFFHGVFMVFHSCFMVFHCFSSFFQRTEFQRTGYPLIFIDGYPSMNIIDPSMIFIDGYPSMNINGYPSMNMVPVFSLWAPSFGPHNSWPIP